MIVMCSVTNSLCFYLSVGKSLLALMVHLIDSDFKLREILIFAKPFSDVKYSAWEIEKVVKSGLASYGIGKYDLTTTPVIDTVRFCSVIILKNVNHVLSICYFLFRSEQVYKGQPQTKQAP